MRFYLPNGHEKDCYRIQRNTGVVQQRPLIVPRRYFDYMSHRVVGVKPDYEVISEYLVVAEVTWVYQKEWSLKE
jgi:hypothetical protein